MRRRIRVFFTNVIKILKRPEMAILPGQLAFFFVLSVVPIITIIGYGASLLNLSMEFISNFLSQAFSSEISKMIIPNMAEVNLGLKFFVSLAIGFFIASNGSDSIIITSNTIYGIKNGTFLRRRIKAIIMTILLVMLFLFILVVPVFGDKILEIIKDVNLNSAVTRNIELVFAILGGPLSWFIIFFIIKIIFTMAPDKRISSSSTTMGSMFTTIGWVLGTFIYSYWTTNYTDYTVFYGGLANIVILMLWIYVMAYLFVIGLSLNYQEEELAKTGQIEKVE